MFDPILRWIGAFLGWLDAITGNYLIALFIFAVIVELLLMPFGIRQQKNSIKQAKLRPKEMAIRNKYKGRNDQATQQKVTQEIQKLYQEENFNPMSGCLQLLLQMPILIALYNIVINPLKFVAGMSDEVINTIVTYVKDTFEIATVNAKNTIELIAVIKDRGLEAFAGMESGALEALTEVYNNGLPNFDLFGLDLGVIPSLTKPGILLIIPVVTFVVYFVSMKLTRKLTYQPTQAENDKAAGCSNSMMDITMPLFSVFLSFSIPAIISVYWIFKSILNTVKQFILSRVMPYPVFTEEDYKAAEKAYGGKVKAEKREKANSGKVRSLHHIDDEDYEQPETPAPKASSESAEANPMIGPAPIKDDRRITRATEQKPSDSLKSEDASTDENNDTK